MITERLPEILNEGVSLRQADPHILSVYPTDDSGSVYDQSFGNIYETVACNSLYNRILWGYWPGVFNRLALEALGRAGDGWFLDTGCGSLAFTARAYTGFTSGPVVLLDSSMKLLRMAGARMKKLCGGVPDNMVFLHADAMQMPFRSGAFSAIIAQNLLHAVSDAGRMLSEIARVSAPGGTVSITTLIESGRFSDAYLRMLAGKGLMVRRNAGDIMDLLDQAGIMGSITTRGNMAFIQT